MRKKLLVALMCIFTFFSSNYGVTAESTDQVEALNNVSSEFEITDMTIAVAGEVVYKNKQSADAVLIHNSASPTMSFDLTWAAIDQDADQFVEGDYFDLELITVKGSTSGLFINFSSKRDLFFEGVKIATAELRSEKVNEETVKLWYRIIFTSGIRNKEAIQGSLYGGAVYKGVQESEYTEFRFEGKLLIKVEYKKPTPSENPGGVIEPTRPNEMKKSVNSTKKDIVTITWRVGVNHYLANQFKDYEDDYQNVKYDNLIIEETLDSNQSFTSAGNSKVANIHIPIYLYTDDFMKDGKAIRYTYHLVTGLYDKLERIESTGNDYETVSEAVRNKPLSYAIVKETIPDSGGRTRERLIINFGANGTTSIRLSDIDPGHYKSMVTKMKKSLDYVTEVVKGAKLEGKNPDDIIQGNYDDSHKLSEWEKMVGIYEKSYAYYSRTENGKYVGPYIYDLGFLFTTGVYHNDPITKDVLEVVNSVVITSGQEKFEYKSQLDNFWNDSISVKAVMGDVVVYKADSLYNNVYIEGTEKYPGLIPGVGFAIYNTENTRMAFNKTDGKYVYSTTGTELQVVSGTDGKLILNNLPVGDYYLVELVYLDGYYRVPEAANRIPFSTSKNTIGRVMVQNEPRTVILKKVDADVEGSSLQGAEFELYHCSTATCDGEATKVSGFAKTEIKGLDYYTVNPNGKDLLITGADGMLRITRLAAGYYYLIEKAAPIGYVRSEDKVFFQLSEENVDDAILDLGTFENNEDRIYLLGTKTWDDYSNIEGFRPDTIELTLYADNIVVEGASPVWTSKELNNWTYAYFGLPKYKNGEVINYTVLETPVPGYALTQNGFDLLNKRTPTFIDINGKKTWVDDSNIEGFRPDAIQLILKANGVVVEDRVPIWTNVNTDEWTYEYQGLPCYRNGEKIEYTVEEVPVPGYVSRKEVNNFINTRGTTKTSVTGTKTWVDDGNIEGFRPDSIQLILRAGNDIVSGIVPTWTNTDTEVWSYEFKDLPKFRSGKEIKYSVEEVPVEGYIPSQDGDNFTNTRTTSMTNVTGTKTWEDEGNIEGFRPESIHLILRNEHGIVETAIPVWTNTDTDVWTYEFKDLPKYRAGKEIQYSVEEVKVDGYLTTQNGLLLKNIRIPTYIKLSGTKTWNDDSDSEGFRPENIELILRANGELVEEISPVWLNKSGDVWTYEYNDLPKYRNGDEVNYTVEEIPVDKYRLTQEGLNLTNTHTITKTKVEGTKTWEDEGNIEGFRPANIQLILRADNDIVDGVLPIWTNVDTDVWTYEFKDLPKYRAGKEIQYSVEEVNVEGYLSLKDGLSLRNIRISTYINLSGTKTWIDDSNSEGFRPESIELVLRANGEIVEEILPVWLNKSGDVWTYEYYDLPKYRNGNEINYTVEEMPIAKYEGSQDGYDFYNTHMLEKVNVVGTKQWIDDNNIEGFRPDTLTLILRANGEIVEGALPIWFETSDSTWTYEFKDLPKYMNGDYIMYTVEEVPVLGYESAQDGYNFINTRLTTRFNIRGTKTWDDANNIEGYRPESIELILRANGEIVQDVNLTWTRKDGNVWAYEYKDLLKYHNGQEIEYTVEEVLVPGYALTQDVFNFTNTRLPSTLNITGTKTWVDDGNVEGFRPRQLTVVLKADGVVVEGATPSWTGTDGDVWTYEFKDLPKYRNGKEIHYSVEETPVAGYVLAQTGFNFVNTRITSKVDLKGTKTWLDRDNVDRIRPLTLRLTLKANGVDVEGVTPIWTETDTNVWSYVYKDLPKYLDGKEIAYTVEEALVDGYVLTQNGFDLTNTHTPRGRPVGPRLPDTGRTTTNKPVILPSTGIPTDTAGYYIVMSGLVAVLLGIIRRRKSAK